MTLFNLASIHPAPKSGSLSHHSRLTTPLGLIEFSIRWLWSIATNPLLELTDDPETSGQHDKAYHS